MSCRMHDISIIVVSWNARAYLVKCLESLHYGIRGLSAEIIVVDNSSTDGSPEAVEKIFPGVRLIKCEKNLGFAKANNVGIRASTGKYVCLVNSDVELLDGCIKTLLACMDANPRAAAAGPLVLNPDLSIQPSCRSFPSVKSSLLSAAGLDRLNYLPTGGLTEAEAVSGCFLIARLSAINEVGVLDERFFFYAEDTDWCKRFHDSGWKLLWCTDAKAIHYGGGSSSNAPVRYYIELYKANLKYWRKHKGSVQRAVYIAITGIHQIARMLKGIFMFLLKPAGREAGAHSVRRSAACIKWLISGKNEL